MVPWKEDIKQDWPGEEKDLTPSNQDLIDMQVEVLVEEAKVQLREKAEAWAEEKASQKAIVIANKEKELSVEEKQFSTLQAQVKYYSDWWALPKGTTEAQAMMTIQMWKQMNMNMFEALQGIWYVNWKMIIYWEVMIWQLTKAGYRLKFIQTDEKVCEVTISWSNWEITEKFTIEQAKKAGWVKWFGPWVSQPHLMLRYKAVRQGIKFLCPEVMWGTTTYEEAITETIEEDIPTQAEIEINITDKFQKDDK